MSVEHHPKHDRLRAPGICAPGTNRTCDTWFRKPLECAVAPIAPRSQLGGPVDLRPHAVPRDMAPSVGKVIHEEQAPPAGLGEKARTTRDRGETSRRVSNLYPDSVMR